MLIVYQTGDQFFSFMIVDFGTAFKSGNLMKPAKIFDCNSFGFNEPIQFIKYFYVFML